MVVTKMRRRPNHSINPNDIKVTYRCSVLKKDIIVKLSDLTFSGYGCFRWSCGACGSEDSGTEISVYCKCGKSHIIKEY